MESETTIKTDVNGNNKKQKRTSVKKRLFTPRTLLGGLLTTILFGKICSKKNGINDNNIDECKKYKTGKNDITKNIGTKIEEHYYSDGTTFRTGCSIYDKPINDDMIDHNDVCFFDVDLDFGYIFKEVKTVLPDIEDMPKDEIIELTLKTYNDISPVNIQGQEVRNRYNYKCFDLTNDYHLTVGMLKKCNLKNNGELCELNTKDKKTIVNGYNNYFKKKIKGIEKDNNIKTITLKYTNHRNQNGDYAFPVYPKDLKPAFLTMMDSEKNIFIKEFSCYYSEDFPKLIIELLEERPNYNGNIILQRNSKYEEEVYSGYEVNVALNDNGNVDIKSNNALQQPEFLLFNRKEIKCISENKARKILGGSYLTNIEKNKKFNITYAKKVFKECKKMASEYEKYSNKHQEEKIYDDPLTKAILNEEAKNKAKKKDITKTGDL